MLFEEANYLFIFYINFGVSRINVLHKCCNSMRIKQFDDKHIRVYFTKCCTKWQVEFIFSCANVFKCILIVKYIFTIMIKQSPIIVESILLCSYSEILRYELHKLLFTESMIKCISSCCPESSDKSYIKIHHPFHDFRFFF